MYFTTGFWVTLQSRFLLLVEKKRIPETRYDAKEMKLSQKKSEESSIQT